MSDTRTSREIIWQHAFDYRWERKSCVGGDPQCDLFIKASPSWRETLVVVHYAANGRVLDAFLNGQRMNRLTRNKVMDVIEGRNA